MTQRGAVFIGPTIINLDFPAPEQDILPGVQWGRIEAFPSPAYWAYQIPPVVWKSTPSITSLGERSKRKWVPACWVDTAYQLR